MSASVKVRSGVARTVTPKGSLALSEQGPVRSINADHIKVDDQLGAYIVADGVGQFETSAEASRFAAATAHRLLRDALRANPLEAPDLAAIVRAVWPSFVEHFPGLPCPATTLTLVTVRGGWINYASVGDSPVFLLTGGGAHLLTRDHTIADRGRVISSYSALKTLGGSNVLFSSIGRYAPQPVSYDPLQCVAGARLVICSDGLLEVVSQEQLGQLSRTAVTLGALRRAIARRGAAQRAPDNYSAIFVNLGRKEMPHDRQAPL